MVTLTSGAAPPLEDREHVSSSRGLRVLGIDPGPSTGMALLRYDPDRPGNWGWTVLQVNGADALAILDLLLTRYQPALIAVEAFIPGNRAGSKGKSAELTRNIVGEIKAVKGVPVKSWRATDVKLWASDKRLLVTRFPMGPKFRDARDAGRHALYAAVRDGGVRDPLA